MTPHPHRRKDDMTDYKNGYILGPPKFFGKVIGKCSICNGLIGSAMGGCDRDHTPWLKPDGTYHQSLLIEIVKEKPL